MESAMPPFPQNEMGKEGLAPFEIDMLIDAQVQLLEQAMSVSIQLIQKLERQVDEVDELETIIKQDRSISKEIRKVWRHQDTWWNGIAGEVELYRKDLEAQIIRMRGIKEQYYEEVRNYKEMRNNMINENNP